MEFSNFLGENLALIVEVIQTTLPTRDGGGVGIPAWGAQGRPAGARGVLVPGLPNTQAVWSLLLEARFPY